MNISKFTLETKQELIQLYKINLPVSMLAELFCVNYMTILKHLPREAKEDAMDFKESPMEQKLALLKLYAWLISDEKDCTMAVGTPRIAKAAPLLFNYLRLAGWQHVLDGAIEHYNLFHENRFQSVPEGFQKLINDVVPPLKAEGTAKETLARVLKLMHAEKISFPDAKDIGMPRKALAPFIRAEFAFEETFARYFDEAFVSYLESILSQESDTDRAMVLKSYGIADPNAERVLQNQTFAESTVARRTAKTVATLRTRMRHEIQNPLAASVKQRLEIAGTRTSLHALSKDFDNLKKMYAEVSGPIEEKLTRVSQWAASVETKIFIPDAVKEIIKSSVIKTDACDPSLSAVLQTPLEDLGLPTRLFNALKAAHINTLRDLVTWKQEALMKLRNIGLKSVNDLERLLAKKGLSFGMTFL